ncbi:MAG: 50S ribosomal protein L23 [Bacteroidetes bacterium ADurb.Bin217]|nr:MAG: 50S ribosomal protein L23 [Bacteroidetes bacterium ADurb.Bin217]
MEILQRPLITEKMSKKSDALNQYGFIVDERADKIQIKKAVEDMYGVTVESVNTIRYAGKVKARNTKSGVVVGKTNSYKKAIVSLKQGEQIDFYSNI